MDSINTSAELTGTVSRIQMLRDEIASDIKNGKEFHSLVPVSARRYFGPKWLDKVLGRMDSMEIFKHSEKDGLIPYDLILSGMDEAKEEYNDDGRKNIMICVSAKNFDGKVSVLSADDKKAVLGIAYKGSFSGTFVNAEEIEPAEKEIESLEQRLTQIMQQSTVSEEKEEVPAVKSHAESPPVIITSIPAAKSHSRFPGYAMLSIGLCLTLYSMI